MKNNLTSDIDKFNAEKLWESEESLRVLMNSNPEAVFILDTKGNFIAANEKTAQRFGKTVEELVGTNVFSYLTPELAAKRKAKVDEVISTGKPVRFDDSRNNRYFDNYLHPILDTKGNVIRISVWVIDFTERKLAIDALKASEEKFRELAENIQEIFWIRKDDEVIYVSPAYETICGKSCQTLYKNPDSFLEAIHPDDIGRVIQSYNSDEYKKSGIFNEEFRIVRPDGTIRWIWSKTFPVVKDGKVLRTVGVAEDISLRKEYEEKIRQSLIKEKELNELKTRFISIVSHDFRTPLGVILSAAELLQNYGEKWDKKKRDEQFEKIKKAVENLTGLMKDVTDLNKYVYEEKEMNPEKIEMVSFVKEIIEEISANFEKSPSVTLQHKDKNIFICSDKKLLRHIFLNLILNAVKFTPHGKNVTVFIDKNEESFYSRIIDKGIGIPKEDIKNIFQPFIRATNASDIKGTGLGLSIVKHAVDTLKGKIEIQSELNNGTEIILTLPTGLAN